MQLNSEHCAQLSTCGLYLQPGTTILGECQFTSPCYLFPGNLCKSISLGGGSYCSPGCFLSSCQVGNYSSIGDGCLVFINHPLDRLSTSASSEGVLFPGFAGSVPRGPDPQTVIGSDVWIGSRVCLKSGIHIGDGAIIGAGSVVTKDVPPYTVVAGNAARIIRPRFSEEFTQRVMASQWFNYDWSTYRLPWDSAEDCLGHMENLLATYAPPRFAARYICSADADSMTLKRVQESAKA